MDAMLGYRILTSNGGMRAFGSASFGTAAWKLGTGVTATAIAASRKTGGYLILKSDGGVLGFSARWHGSLRGLSRPECGRGRSRPAGATATRSSLRTAGCTRSRGPSTARTPASSAPG